MKYSILVVNFNMSGLVDHCVQCLEKHFCAGEDYEIIIADNSTDSAFRMPENYSSVHPRVRIVPLSENRGWIHALNQILHQAVAEYVIIMHADVDLEQGCVERLRAFFETHPDAGIVSPNLCYPDGTECRIRLYFPSVRVELRRVANILCHIISNKRFFRDEYFWDHREDVQVDMVMSVFMMFRRRVIERIAPILPDLWTYCGNDYLCERARRLGWRCYYLAAARAVHYERHSNRELYSSDASSAYKRSSTPVSDRMLRDKFRFLRDLYSWPHVAAFRVIATFEFAIHIAALLRQPRAQRREALAKYLATIHALWSY